MYAIPTVPFGKDVVLMARGTDTVRTAAALVTPEALAVMLLLPAATPVAKPELLIVATLVLLEAQVNVTPLIGLPLASLAVAVNC